MKVQVISLDGQPIEKIELPPVFDTELRPDVIKRAVLAAQTARLQPWGPDEMAGKRTSAQTLGKGVGVSRVLRVKGGGSPAAGLAAFAPNTVGGRRAHPPRVEKVLRERVNRKERRLAVRSAIAATKDRKLVASRGHNLDKIAELPLVVNDELEGINKTNDVKGVLQKLGLWGDVERVANSKKVRAGIGKMRGRRYRSAVGLLIVVSEDRGIGRGAGNLPGVKVVKATELSAEVLAPGGTPGRLTVWTKGAIQKMAGGQYA